MPGRLNIAALARRTGVGADTLRKWEQRYGILRPQRTAGGQRRYSDADIARVEWLKARLTEGYRIGEAAALLGEGPGRATPVTPAGSRRALYDAARRSDASEIDRLLDQLFALVATEEALTGVVVPLLERIGAGWHANEVTVAQEHLVSQAVRARLLRLLAEPRSAVRGRVVLACGPGERHELGLLMVALLLRADGWAVDYLGAEMPVADALAHAATAGAAALGVSVTMPDRLTELSRELERAEIPPGLTVLLGGAAASADVARVLELNYVRPGLSNAVTQLRKVAA